MPQTAAKSARESWRRALEQTAPIGRDGTVFPVLVERLAERYGAAPALLSETASLSYRELADRTAFYAGWAARQRLGGGEVVCLIMPNCPDYLAIWVGVSRVGGIVALVNAQLEGAALTHAIGIAAPRHIVVAAELAASLTAVRQTLAPGVRCWSHGAPVPGMARIDDAGDSKAPPLPPPPSLADTALYIYTSGTTGLPKAARISHRRIMQWSLWFAGMMDTRPSDRMYDCLPMHHSIGGIVAIGAVLANGGSVVLRRGFSASRFWDDVVGLECTLFQYIGELCRYLVAAPPHPLERQHRLRLCCGNGLRAEVWEAFERRFRIPWILEFYAATEGTVSLYNCEGRPGAIGRIPGFLRHRFAVELIAVDAETRAPQRDANGFCRRCAVDEAGEAIGRVGGDGDGFEGYTDAAASATKILRDVFEKGDAWYRTGDLMRRDADGYYHFVDRLGDTFRWKGENVSTTEVEQAITSCPGVRDSVVYGVAVPGADGRAGMAAIVIDAGFDLAVLRRHLGRHLPTYARPLFLRVTDRIATTASHKPVKHKLAQDGCDPGATADPLYFDDRVRREYVPLDAALYERICQEAIRP